VPDRVPFDELHRALTGVLVEEGFEEERAEVCALLFAEASRDGVHSHGLGRFPRFVRMIRNGSVDPRARPVLMTERGALERWDGRLGAGNLNARESMARAVELARGHGIGCVALARTNHWMRAGSYGWQAADAGMIGICWTNTLPNLPPWGTPRPMLGNNPLVIAVPRPTGHVVLDMAMSQFSYGALEGYARRGERLPVVGGFDDAGEPSRDAEAILASARPLPIGYWKGSGLALLLDLVAAVVSGGMATHELGTDPEREAGLSQIFIAIDPRGPETTIDAAGIAERIVSPLEAEEGARYPGAKALRERSESLRAGVWVDEAIWRWVRAPAAVRRETQP
jgi:3-dehydro-L-gulonate 2-dehydrogenase